MKRELVITNHFVFNKNILLRMKKGFGSAFDCVVKISAIVMTSILIWRLIVVFFHLAQFQGMGDIGFLVEDAMPFLTLPY